LRRVWRLCMVCRLRRVVWSASGCAARSDGGRRMRGAVLALHLLLCCLGAGRCFCPAQCSCTFHGRDDGSGSR